MRRILLTVMATAMAWVPVRAVLAADDAAALTAPTADAMADASDGARRSRPVAQIGDRTVTVGELEDRIAALPPLQRATFGDTPDAVRRGFLLQVLIPEGLFALEAARLKLDQTLPTAFEVERAESNATLRAIRNRLGPASAIPMADVQAYYDQNRDRYDTPERYQIWRILCKTQDEAAQVLEQAKKNLDTKTFGDLARDHSIDKASNLRAGNLGFISPDGTSSEPGLKLDPVVVRAVQAVRDGQLVPTPIHEPDGYAVVWRRGTIPATKRSVEDVAAQIRDTLWKARVKENVDKLVATLREKKLRDYNEAPLADLPATIGGDAGVLSVRAAPSIK